jgi:hypothetical protein
MSKYCHVINFQNLKKFFPKNYGNYRVNQRNQGSFKFNSEKVEDSKIFGSAYHKILEQDEQIIRKLAKSQSIYDLNSIIENYNLSIAEKNILLQMIKKIYSHNFYQNAICAAKYIHREQKLCHFISKNQYVFRLESIIDGILSIHGRTQVIIDYKTVNSISLIDRQICESFYWMQLLFYKYIYENCFKNNKIFDLVLFFQSKNKHDNYEIVVKKFSDLPKHGQKEYEENFQDGLQKYIDHYCKYGRSEKEVKISSSLTDGIKLERKKKIFLSNEKKGKKSGIINISIKSSITAIIGVILFLFEKSQNLVGDEKILFIVLIVLAVIGLYFIFKE